MLERAYKNWCLRETIHIFRQEDLPLLLYQGRTHFRRSVDTLGEDDHLSAQQKAFFAKVIRFTVADGQGDREELYQLCRQQGMTASEEQSACQE